MLTWRLKCEAQQVMALYKLQHQHDLQHWVTKKKVQEPLQQGNITKSQSTQENKPMMHIFYST